MLLVSTGARVKNLARDPLTPEDSASGSKHKSRRNPMEPGISNARSLWQLCKILPTDAILESVSNGDLGHPSARSILCPAGQAIEILGRPHVSFSFFSIFFPLSSTERLLLGVQHHSNRARISLRGGGASWFSSIVGHGEILKGVEARPKV